jgi:hypothetical protein
LQIAVDGNVDSITHNVVLLETLNNLMIQENAAGEWYSENQPNGSWVQIPDPNQTGPIPLAVPGAGSFKDAQGNVYTIDANRNADENGRLMNGGSGTKALEDVNGLIYGQDAQTGAWYTWDQSKFIAAPVPPPSNTSSGSSPTTITMTAAQTANATVNENDIVLNLVGGNRITFLGGSSVIQATGSNTITDNGSDNTIVLGATGDTTVNAHTLTNGDVFDLSQALKATTWDGLASDLGNYLKMGTSKWGQNAILSMRDTATGRYHTAATITGSGSLSLSQFLAHATT